MIEIDDFELMIGFFRTACIKNGLKKAVVVSFLEFLSAHQDQLCRSKGEASAIPDIQDDN